MSVSVGPGAIALTVTPCGAALERERPGQADDAGLGGAVVGEPGHALVGDLRGEVDDPAEAAGAHARIERVRHQERPRRCTAIIRSQLGASCLERRLVDDAGAVHQDVDGADPGLDLTHGLRDRIRIGDVAFTGETGPALRLDLGDQALRVRASPRCSMAIAAPSAANARATAAPMPRLPPVIRAMRPASLPSDTSASHPGKSRACRVASSVKRAHGSLWPWRTDFNGEVSALGRDRYSAVLGRSIRGSDGKAKR